LEVDVYGKEHLVPVHDAGSRFFPFSFGRQDRIERVFDAVEPPVVDPVYPMMWAARLFSG
jgi:hypothetical protein